MNCRFNWKCLFCSTVSKRGTNESTLFKTADTQRWYCAQFNNKYPSQLWFRPSWLFCLQEPMDEHCHTCRCLEMILYTLLWEISISVEISFFVIILFARIDCWNLPSMTEFGGLLNATTAFFKQLALFCNSLGRKSFVIGRLKVTRQGPFSSDMVSYC